MTRLYTSLLALLIVFSTALGFLAATAWDSWWVWGLVGGILVVAFLALGGKLVPPARAALPARDAASASALLRAFGALCTAEVLLLGLVLWIWGNRTYASSTPYQVLGLLIFLALVGAGVPGALTTLVLFLRSRALLHAEAHRAGAGHSGVHAEAHRAGAGHSGAHGPEAQHPAGETHQAVGAPH